MTMYNWSFSGLKVSKSEGNLDNVIVSVNYCLSLSKGGASTYCRGEVSFSSPDPDNFIEFSAISESDMISFVEGALGDSLEQIKRELDERLRVSDAEEKELPWLPSPSPGLPSMLTQMPFG